MDPCPKLSLRDRKGGSSGVSLGRCWILSSHPGGWEQHCSSLRGAVKPTSAELPRECPELPMFLLGFTPSICLPGHLFERPSRHEPGCGERRHQGLGSQEPGPGLAWEHYFGAEQSALRADHPLPWWWVAPCSGLFLLLTSILRSQRTPFFPMTPQGAGSGA